MKTGDYIDGRRVTVLKDEIETGTYEGVTQFPTWRLRPETVNRWIWRLKQLLPLTYRTTYGDAQGQHFTVWKMWLGRCFAIDDVLVAQPFEAADGPDRLEEAEAELAESGIFSDQTWRDFSLLMRGDLATILTSQSIPRMGAYDGERFFRWGAAAYALGRMDAGTPSYWEPDPIDAPGVMSASMDTVQEWAKSQKPQDLENLFSWLEHKLWGPLEARDLSHPDPVHGVVRTAGEWAVRAGGGPDEEIDETLTSFATRAGKAGWPAGSAGYPTNAETDDDTTTIRGETADGQPFMLRFSKHMRHLVNDDGTPKADDG